MRHWLMKAEPDSRIVKEKDVKFSVDDFEKIQITPWEGVRNHTAKLNMKNMSVGDKVLFYHSSCKVPGVAAIAEVHKEAYPDYTAWDPEHPYHDAKTDQAKPTWFMVDVQFKNRVEHFVSLNVLKAVRASVALDEDSAVPYLTKEQRQAISDMPLLTQGRLSVQPVSEMAFDAIEQMGNTGGWEDSEAAPKKTRKRKGTAKDEVADDEPESTVGGEESQTQVAETQETAVEGESSKATKGKRRKKAVEPEEPASGTRRSTRTRTQGAS